MKDRSRKRGDYQFSLRYGTVAPTEQGCTLDISHSGMSIECNQILKDVKMVVFLETDKGTLQLIVRRKWDRKLDPYSKWGYIMGVEIEQAPREYHLLVQYLIYHYAKENGE